jgi:hypothetical protein
MRPSQSLTATCWPFLQRALDLPKLLLQPGVRNQIFATNALRPGRSANQYGNIRIEVGGLPFSRRHSSLFQIWFGFASGMAKQSLKKRIDALVDALGAAEKPSFLEIRNELVPIGIEVEALEDGQALAEKEAQIAVLEAALEKSNLENSQLQVELQTANAELETFRAAEREKQEGERKKDLPDKQFEILEWLPSEYGGEWRGIGEIADAVGIPVDEAEIHLSKLRKAQLAISRYNAYDAVVWHRSETGNELVLAKRLAGEAEQAENKYYADLPLTEHKALGIIAAARENGASEAEIANKLRKTAGRTRLALMVLEGKDFAGQPPEDPEKRWFLRTRGAFYLAERGLL